MDNLFERFLRKIGIEDVCLYEGCRFLSQKYNKEKDLLTIEIEQKDYFTYQEAKLLLDAIDHAPFKVDVNFVYKNGYDEKALYNLLKDQFISFTGLSNNDMPKYKFDKKTITFYFYGMSHKVSFEPVIEMWEQLLDDLQISIEIETKLVFSGEEIEKRENELKTLLPKINEVYKKAIENHKITEQTSQRQRGNYVDFKIKDINEESGNVRIVGKIFQSESRVLKNGKTLVDFYIYDKTSSIEVIV